MSEKPEGPGWWIASDGKWYPPELHPSNKSEGHGEEAAPTVASPPPRRWQGQEARNEHVGPQFPDLFQKAMQGSHLADNISVKYDGDDNRNAPRSTPSASSMTSTSRAKTGGGGVAVGVAGASIDAPAKRKWRKGR
jgi:hypothetical protein